MSSSVSTGTRTERRLPSTGGRWPVIKRRGEPYAFISPTVILLTGLMVIPVLIVIYYSVMDNVIVEQNPAFVGLANYVKILTDGEFFSAIGHTIIFIVASMVAHLIIGLAFAMMLNTRLLGAKTKAVFRVIFILPWVFTAAVVAVLWRLLLDPAGVINFLLTSVGLIDQQIPWLAEPGTALLAITVINIWSGYPFFMISLLAGLQGISRDLYEAATVDGATPFQQFRNVTLPALRPIIYSMGLLDLLWTTQQFTLIWATTGGGPIHSTEVLSTFTYKLAFSSYQFSMASTSAVIVLFFSMIIAIFYVRAQKKAQQ